MRLALLFVFFFAGPLNAQSDLFAAAGRLETVEGRPMCSAALIAPDVIATAAHCVDKQDQSPDVLFRRMNNASEEALRIERFVIHPLYSEFQDESLRHLRFDIAVGRLATPVAADGEIEFQIGDEAREGEGLFLVSWPNRSGDRPRQRRCLVLEGSIAGVITLGCRVRGGESGAPVLRLTEDGVEIVAVINSTATINNRSVALAADVRLRIPPLLDRLNEPP